MNNVPLAATTAPQAAPANSGEVAGAARSGATAMAGRREWLLSVLLVAAVLLAFFPAWNGRPIWDDDAHMTKPELRSVEGLAQIWIRPGAAQQYYPLVHSAFWLEYKLWGDSPLGYHLVNLLLHAACALLLVRILRRLNLPGAWLAGTIFALHPLQVETAAWITELKNTLSGLCYLGAALIYLRFDRDRKRHAYVLALGIFLVGLMAKTVIATLPAALLLVFWWKRGRLSWRSDVLPLLPFFGAGAAAGLFTAWMERTFIGADGSEFGFSLVERGLIAGRAFWFYLGKLVWPVNLIFIYPRWQVSEAVAWQYLFPVMLLVALAVLWLVRGRSRGPLTAALFFVGTLFPALGFVNVYPFRYSFVADHFQYLACIGPLALAAAGVTLGLRRLSQKIHVGGVPSPRVVTDFIPPASSLLACILPAIVLGVLTWRQCGMYAGVETLWRTTLERNPGCWMAHANLGDLLLQRGEVENAIAENRRALAIKPDAVEARNNLGNALLKQNHVDEAIAQFRQALQVRSDYAETHNNLGNALLRQGHVDEAMIHFRQAVQIKPGDAGMQNNLGNALCGKGRADEAIAHFRRAVALEPGNAEFHYNLANTLLKVGRVDEAIAHFGNAVAIRPDYVNARFNLAATFLQAGRVGEAVAQFERVVALKPDDLDAQNSLAWLLATTSEPSIRNGKKAVELAERANRLANGENLGVLHTLAAAQAAAGDFAAARSSVVKAMELARIGGGPELVAQLDGELKRYAAGLPFQQPTTP